MRRIIPIYRDDTWREFRSDSYKNAPGVLLPYSDIEIAVIRLPDQHLKGFLLPLADIKAALEEATCESPPTGFISYKGDLDEPDIEEPEIVRKAPNDGPAGQW